ncbi:MAG: AsmA family protein, partial [Sneathiella sp.]|nr:AsmA family protein [Sneathiella sp.]
MKKIVYGILGIFVLVIAAVIALPFLVPAEKIKEELVLAVNDATGRTLAIDGDFGVSVFPVLGLNASKVSFSNSPNSPNPNMATTDELTVELDLLSLLSGQIQVNTFILDKPVVFLEVEKNGEKNWEFSQSAPQSSKPKESTDPSEKIADLGITDLNLGNVKIISGAITYIDRKANAQYEVTDVNLAVVLNGLDQPFKTTGNATWNGETLELDTELGALRAVLENKETTLTAAIKSTKINASYKGSLTSVTPLALLGKTDLKIPSVKNLTGWIGQPIDAKENTFGALSINGTIKINGSTYAFKEAELSFDKIKGKGDFKVDLGGKIPNLEGKLDLAALDVNPYLPKETQSEPKQKKEENASKSEKWDSTPIDFSGLKAVYAKFELSV